MGASRIPPFQTCQDPTGATKQVNTGKGQVKERDENKQQCNQQGNFAFAFLRKASENESINQR